MPQVADHIALANKNQLTLSHLTEDVENHPEWVATIAFYKALQLVEALFVFLDGNNCHGHQVRNRKLNEPRFRAVNRQYKPLFRASMIARYLHDNEQNIGYCSFNDFLTSDQVQSEILNKRLRNLEQAVLQLLPRERREQVSQVVIKHAPPANHLKKSGTEKASSADN
jgi:hypothetical protein